MVETRDDAERDAAIRSQELKELEEISNRYQSGKWWFKMAKAHLQSDDDSTLKAAIEADLGNGVTLGTFVAGIAFAIIFQDVQFDAVVVKEWGHLARNVSLPLPMGAHWWGNFEIVPSANSQRLMEAAEKGTITSLDANDWYNCGKRNSVCINMSSLAETAFLFCFVNATILAARGVLASSLKHYWFTSVPPKKILRALISFVKFGFGGVPKKGIELSAQAKQERFVTNSERWESFDNPYLAISWMLFGSAIGISFTYGFMPSLLIWYLAVRFKYDFIQMKDEQRLGVYKSMEEVSSDGPNSSAPSPSPAPSPSAAPSPSSSRGRSSSTGRTRSASGSRFLGRSNSGSQSRRKGSKKNN